MIALILPPPFLPMLVSGGVPSVELHLFDTYIVTDSLTVSIILSIILGIIGFFYWKSKVEIKLNNS